MHMDHKFSEIDHVTPLFNFFLVVHLPTHSGAGLYQLFQREKIFLFLKKPTFVLFSKKPNHITSHDGQGKLPGSADFTYHWSIECLYTFLFLWREFCSHSWTEWELNWKCSVHFQLWPIVKKLHAPNIFDKNF